jgi:adenylate kinase
MTPPTVICVLGISGVGKSRLVAEVAARIPAALHLQGSALIKQGLADRNVSSEELRRSGGDTIIANQCILVEMFSRAVSEHNGNLVLFDGHLVIDTDAGLVELPQAVIGALRPKALVHLEAEPSLIASRRGADKERKRPVRDVATLAAHQRLSRELCLAYAEGLRVPIHIFRPDEVAALAALAEKMPS